MYTNITKTKGGKGSLYTLEAAIAILIMVITLFLALRQPQKTQELNIPNYKLSVYKILKISGDIGDLRRNALNNDTATIKNDIISSGPSYLNYEVAIYNRADALTDIPSIESENIVIVSYFIAGKVGNYGPKEVRVFIWGFD